MFWYISSYISLSDDCNIKICKFTALSSGSFCQIYRVTDEALVAETAVWPNSFRMNVFFAFKGSKLFIMIPHPSTNKNTNEFTHCHLILETFFIYDLRQKNNKFVIFCYSSLFLFC